ncbi:MAG: glycosyltransferase [Candidatus Bathyarchaeia archaeon]
MKLTVARFTGGGFHPSTGKLFVQGLMGMNYNPPMRRMLVIVCARDEEETLSRCLDSLLGQSRRVDRIVIVDDGSSDSTPEICERYAATHDNVVAVHRQRSGREGGAVVRGIEIAKAFNSGLEAVGGEVFDYLAKVDADMVLSRNYMDLVVSEFEVDPRLGLAGGVTVNEPTHQVRGGNRVFRWSCWMDVSWNGRMPLVDAEDTYTTVKALYKGWRVKLILEARSIHLRSGRVKGLRRTALERLRVGAACYALGYHPLLFLGRSMLRTLSPPYLAGFIASLTGWIHAWIRRAEVEEELRSYLRRMQIQRLKGIIRSPGRVKSLIQGLRGRGAACKSCNQVS